MLRKMLCVMLLIVPAFSVVHADTIRTAAKNPETADSAEVETVRESWPSPAFTVGVLTTEDYVEGMGDVLAPILFTGRGVLFINPRASVTDKDAEEYNLGIGFRHLVFGGG